MLLSTTNVLKRLSSAFVMGKKYKILYEKTKCIGIGTCVTSAPDMWVLESNGIATMKKTGAKKSPTFEEVIIDESELSQNVEAAKGCPVGIIKIIDLETGKQIAPEDN